MTHVTGAIPFGSRVRRAEIRAGTNCAPYETPITTPAAGQPPISRNGRGISPRVSPTPIRPGSSVRPFTRTQRAAIVAYSPAATAESGMSSGMPFCTPYSSHQLFIAMPTPAHGLDTPCVLWVRRSRMACGAVMNPPSTFADTTTTRIRIVWTTVASLLRTHRKG